MGEKKMRWATGGKMQNKWVYVNIASASTLLLYVRRLISFFYALDLAKL